MLHSLTIIKTSSKKFGLHESDSSQNLSQLQTGLGNLNTCLLDPYDRGVFQNAHLGAKITYLLTYLLKINMIDFETKTRNELSMASC